SVRIHCRILGARNTPATAKQSRWCSLGADYCFDVWVACKSAVPRPAPATLGPIASVAIGGVSPRRGRRVPRIEAAAKQGPNRTCRADSRMCEAISRVEGERIDARATSTRFWLTQLTVVPGRVHMDWCVATPS